MDRIIDRDLERYLNIMGAILLTGPKWCGKTTTAMQHANSILNLDDIDKKDQYLKLAELKPSKLLDGEKPRLIDEWQLAPILWDGVRQYVDKTHEKGQYILTGSTSVDESNIIHTGTGRIHRMIMYPMSLYESGESNGKIQLTELFNNPNIDIEGITSDLSLENLFFAMCRGGWPESLQIKNKDDQLLIAKSYFDSICETDVSTVDGVKRNPERVKNLLKSYARNISTPAKDTTIMNDIKGHFDKISKGTYYSYVNALKRIYVIQNIYAWSPNIRSASTMKATTKKEFIDPSIATSALNLSPEKLFQDLKTTGFIFETLCIRDLNVYANKLGGKVYYFRKGDKLEIDCVLLLNDGRYGLIEIKLGKKEIKKGSKNLHKAKDIILENISKNNTKVPEPSFLSILTGGEVACTKYDDIKIIPIGCLR